MKLMSNEENITFAYNCNLTNKRIRHNVKASGSEKITSLFLENIQSISVHYKSKPLVLLLGIVSLTGSLLLIAANENRDEVSPLFVLGALIGLVLIGYYLITRKHFLTISSAAASINIMIKGENSKSLVNYIDLLEETICRRKSELATEVFSNS